MSTLTFPSVVCEDGKVTYNQNNKEILNEVLTEDREKVQEEQIKELGVVLPAYQELEENTVEPEGFVWSTFRATPKDNEATEKFIQIVTSKLYQNKLRDKKSPKFKVWQDIYNEMCKLGFLIADNEKDGGKKCNQKWRNLKSKYMEFKNNAHKTGQASKRKQPYYDIMHAIKYKHKISPPSLLDTLSSNTTGNVIPQNNTLKTQEPQLNISRSETIASTDTYQNKPSTSAASLNCIYTNPKTILKPKNMANPSDILDYMIKQHKEILEMQTKHFEEIKKNMETQNDQGKQMIDLLAKLIDNVIKKKKQNKTNRY